MAEEGAGHYTDTSIANDVLRELCVGSNIVLKVRVSCPSGCDLRGNIVQIVAQDAVVKEIELASFDEVGNETDEFVLAAPTEPGEYTWTAVFPTQEKEGIPHQESSAAFSFIAKPHETSMAVWDLPYPLVLDSQFRFKVGVKCHSECNLVGKKIEIYDHKKTQAVTGILGDDPWSLGGALYWTEVKANAPSLEGNFTWEARFPKSDMEIAHEAASYSFGLRTVTPPEHLVVVRVIAKDTQAPIKGADVILPPYVGRTDETGTVKLGVHKGSYELSVSKHLFEIFETAFNVNDDISIKAELLTLETSFWQR